jgi:NADH-quinone oxidoreductase subunit L
LVFIAFFGELKTEPHHDAGKLMTVPLVVLAILSLVGGFIELPENLGPAHLFSKLFDRVLPVVSTGEEGQSELIFQIISAIISLGGVYIAYLLFYKKSSLAIRFRNSKLNNFFLSGWRFDRVYDILFVKPLVWLSEIDKKDFVDLIYTSIAKTTEYFNFLVSKTQNGKLRWYVLFLTIGVAVLLTLMISL